MPPAHSYNVGVSSAMMASPSPTTVRIKYAPSGACGEGGAVKRYHCPVEVTVDVIGGRWRTVILAHLKEGVHRYGELRRLMPDITEKMLTQVLRELEADGLVAARLSNASGHEVEYRHPAVRRRAHGAGTARASALRIRAWRGGYLRRRPVLRLPDT